MMDDWELLQTYAKDRSETAFAELIQRHLNWVYSAARRQVGDPHLAQDVAQAVFILLARKAGSLRPGTILTGWLFRTTRFVAARAIRAEHRRKVREGIASAMMPTISPPDDNEIPWNQLAPHLDRAVAALSKTDRTAILLRFYEKKPLREVGQHLGLSEDAAKKRVSRAVEKLRRLLTRRGAVLSGTALAVALAEQSVQAAPATLAATVLKVSVASTYPVAILPQLARETLSAWRWAHLKLAVGLAGVVASGVFLAARLTVEYRASYSAVSPGAQPSLPASSEVNATETHPTTALTADAGSNEVMNLTVINAQTKEPLAGVEIHVNREKQDSDGRTDEQGHYQITLPPKYRSDLWVLARHAGFVSARATWHMLRESFQFPRQFTLALKPGILIGGVIQDEQGRPIPNASVSVLENESPTQRTPREVNGLLEQVSSDMIEEEAMTDARGRWQLDSAPADTTEFSLRLAHPGYVSDGIYHSEAEPSIKSLRDLTSVMVMKTGFSITGLVLDQNDQPIAAANVSQGPDRWGSHYPETKTDPAGHFQFANVPPGRLILTVQLDGYAPELTNLDATTQSDPVVFHLATGGTIHGRVIDTTGRPVPDANVVADTWRGYRSLAWRANTDADGRFVWNSAPPDDVQFGVSKKGFLSLYASNRTGLRPSPEEQVITLVPAPHVQGAVLDADTGQPIPIFKIIPGAPSIDIPGDTVWQYYQSIVFADGQYQFDLTFGTWSNLLRVEAEGYETTNSPTFGTSESNLILDFRLHKRNWPSGIVRTPDGQPVSNANAFVVTQAAYVENGQPMRGTPTEAKTRTGGDGSFKLSLPDKPFLLVVTHDDGFAEIPSETTKFPIEIVLQPWGRVEGDAFLGPNPLRGQTISYRTEKAPRVNMTKPQVEYQTSPVQTDDKGHFVLDHVHPGEIFIEPSYMSIDVKAGETTHVTLGGTGRPVIGRILLPPTTTTTTDISNASAFLETKQSGESEVMRQAAAEGLDERARQERLYQWSETDAGRAFRQARRVYRLTVDRDGSFRAEEVPSGSYNLHVQLNDTHVVYSGTAKHQVIMNVSRPIGWLDREVIIPEISDGYTDEPLDLGDLELQPFEWRK